MPCFKWVQGRMKVGDGDTLVRFRQRSERLANMMMSVPHEVKLENSNIGGVPGDWLIPPDAPDDPVIVFLHGGGIVFGWSNPNRRILSYIAKFSGLHAFGVNYRLAPEHPYPAAHEDCFIVYRTLARQGKKIMLIGESSGGVLALATLLRAKAEGLPQPPLCVLISPLVDYRFQNVGYWNSEDVFAHPGYSVGLHQHYIAGNDTRTPDFSPVDADLRGLAPLYVLAGEHDLIRSEAERLADAAKRNDLKMELTIWPHVWHSWHLFVPQLPEATQAHKMLGGVIRQYISR
jgi:monoterpene epsilon-lactone hydrolase